MTFEPVSVRCEARPEEARNGRPGSGRPPRRLELGELGFGRASPPVRPEEAPERSGPTAVRSLSFSESDLARACAAVAQAAGRAAEQAARVRSEEADAALRERLSVAVAELNDNLRRHDEMVRGAVRRLVTAALDALLPALAEERLAAAVARLVESMLEGPPPLAPLILELPHRALPTLAARVPALLGEAGLEGSWEIRAHEGTDTVRVSCGERWAELDLAAWTAGVRERLLAILEAPAGPLPEDPGG